MDDQVTLSLSVKNIVTVGVIIALLVGGGALAFHTYKSVTGQNERQAA